ncbi:hypothetical protein NC651_033004 [Populus alba x Populus x berolinensis]|nr:hypothetical protein NC651_033004 [Populus alba x Populus x berolinensis]
MKAASREAIGAERYCGRFCKGEGAVSG